MKNVILSRTGLFALATVLSGVTAAGALSAAGTATPPAKINAQGSEVTRVDFRGGKGHHRGGGMMRHMLEQVDANGDGAVTQAEIDTFRANIVSEADASGEGDISLDEFETIYLKLTRERMVDAFQKLDADGDGVVTQAEMDKRFGNIVERMDRNDDGQLDRDDHRNSGKRDGRKRD